MRDVDLEQREKKKKMKDFMRKKRLRRYHDDSLLPKVPVEENPRAMYM